MFYLLIVLKLIVQDDSVGLVGLRPGQGDAVHGAADLVHDGHSGRSCRKKKKRGHKTSLSKDPPTDRSQHLESFTAASRQPPALRQEPSLPRLRPPPYQLPS